MPIPTPLAIEPLRYEPSFESLEEDEEETTRQLNEALLRISEIVHKDEGHAYRSVHAKSHGLLLAELRVPGGLSAALAQGVFAKSGTYPVAMRFSTSPGDLLDDVVSTPRGVALKIVGVEGERVPGSEGHKTQDFLMVNGPVFSAPTAKAFLGPLKLLAATTDKAPGLKKVLSNALRGLETIVEKAGGQSATLKTMGGHPFTHILGETFFTQVPMRHGPYMAKLSLAPVSPELVALADARLDLGDKPDGIRQAVLDHFAVHGGEWELRVQLCTDIEAMPVEDASVEWSQGKSPYVPVARLVAGPQVSWSAARSAAVDDGMSFSPWHSLEAHRPIGSVMRVRKAAYEVTSGFRGSRNAVKVQEPTSLTSLPD
jgi:hypothetical protein